MIENREKIDTLSSDIVDNAMKLLDIMSDKSKKIEEIEERIKEGKAYKEKRSIVDVAHEETGLPIKKLQMLLNPAKLTKGGISE